jgi:hypothetical protein
MRQSEASYNSTKLNPVIKNIMINNINEIITYIFIPPTLENPFHPMTILSPRDNPPPSGVKYRRGAPHELREMRHRLYEFSNAYTCGCLATAPGDFTR